MRLTLRFDGSLRAAPSPTTVLVEDGSTAVTSSSLVGLTPSTEPTARLAACAASLHWDDGDDDDNSSHRTIVALGGKLLDPADVAQSGQAEYEGLLLGLAMMDDWIDSTGALSGTSRGMAPTCPRRVVLDAVRIQGDCKTVIEQIRGRSRPRRLEAYWSRANSLLSGIETKCKSADPSPVFVAEHIPRQNNILCDALASHIVLRRHQVNADELWKSIEAYAQLLDTPSTPTLEELLHDVQCLIPHGLRPTFYVRLADAAWATSAFRDLVSVGQQMEKEIKAGIAAYRRRRPTGGSNPAERRNLAELHAASAMLQTIGSRHSGLSRESDRLCRRHKHALDGHSDLVRAMEQVADENGSFFDAVQQRIDLPPPIYRAGATIHRGASTQDESAAINEWSRLAWSSKEWDNDGSYVLRLQ